MSRPDLPAAGAAALRILLIEDNPGDAVIFREKLNEGGLDYELVHADRLGDGLDQVRGAGPFDILLCDLSLPDAQGIEAVMSVRDAAPDRPLIVLTGLDDAGTAGQAKRAGAVDYLVKWYMDGASLTRYIRYAVAQYDADPVASPAEPPADPPPASAGAGPETDAGEAPKEEPPADEPTPSEPSATPSLVRAARAALGFVTSVEQRSRWMADVLRTTLDLHRHEADGVEVRRELVDLAEVAQHTAAGLRDAAMERGLPLRFSAERKKVVAFTQRSLASTLLCRLLTDALYDADGEDVEVTVAVEGHVSVASVAWTAEPPDPASPESTVLALAADVAARMAERLGGRLDRAVGPEHRHTVTVRLPGREDAEV